MQNYGAKGCRILRSLSLFYVTIEHLTVPKPVYFEIRLKFHIQPQNIRPREDKSPWTTATLATSKHKLQSPSSSSPSDVSSPPSLHSSHIPSSGSNCRQLLIPPVVSNSLPQFSQTQS